jgi:PKD repeat protein
MNKYIAKIFVIIWLSLLFITAISSLTLAETATSNEMELVCHNWLTSTIFRQGQWAGSSNPQVMSIQEIKENDTILARYYEISPDGYIVIPILKELPPVQLYSEDGHLNMNDQDGFLVIIKEILLNRTRLYAQIYGSLEKAQPDTGSVLLGRERRQSWDRLAIDEKTYQSALATRMKQPADEQYGPLLTTAWHQGSPYYNLCPMGDGSRCVVGCVATAAAQILAYHKWPVNGTSEKAYYWNGDNSCGGNTSGAVLTANFTHTYDWANIPNSCTYCSAAQKAALAQLNYDVGVAYSMMYGACGSGAYTTKTVDVFPDYFRYFDQIQEADRINYDPEGWSYLIRSEIIANRPMLYTIYSHAIVCDGWMENEFGLYQIHMNYGWGGSSTAWYSIDGLYCPWSGCSSSIEYLHYNIAPDNDVYFTADTTWGTLPLTVSFTGFSNITADSWAWDFGDGDSSHIQAPSHTYDTPGQHNVTLQITSGAETRDFVIDQCVKALADTLIVSDVQGMLNEQVEVTIYARNTTTVKTLHIPIVLTGGMNLEYQSFTTAGCRTEILDTAYLKHYSTYNDTGRYTFYVYNSNFGSPRMEPGYGPVLKVYFKILDPVQGLPTETISPMGYSPDYMPLFATSTIGYTPQSKSGTASIVYICGDVDHDGYVNLIDILSLIGYKYRGGSPPNPMVSGDVNNDGSVDLLDILFLINYKFHDGTTPEC